MGGHSAWRKRVARGELAKGSGGAIIRHRPHLGRKGKDLIKNRKGHIGEGNPKKKKKRNPEKSSESTSSDVKLNEKDDATKSIKDINSIVVWFLAGVVGFTYILRNYRFT
mmetsp:Transcript_34283/g.48715  ORF Transcript_34283/g.48715 Transcript_34283/m.48715 type:complete len:110 (+) Transcript_34283:86-415(+)